MADSLFSSQQTIISLYVSTPLLLANTSQALAAVRRNPNGKKQRKEKESKYPISEMESAWFSALPAFWGRKANTKSVVIKIS